MCTCDLVHGDVAISVLLTYIFQSYSHQQLLDQQGIYANMWQQQLTADDDTNNIGS